MSKRSKEAELLLWRSVAALGEWSRGTHKVIVGLVPELAPRAKRALSITILSLSYAIGARVLGGDSEMVLSAHPKQVKGRFYREAPKVGCWRKQIPE